MPRFPRLLTLVLAGARLLVFGLHACRDSTTPDSSDLEPRLVGISYVCGRRFQIENGNTAAITVRYELVGGSESGELTLPAATGTAPSRTRLVTLSTGAVRLSYDGTRIGEAANAGGACPPASPAPPEPQAT